MSTFRSPTPRQLAFGLTVLRVIIGVTFIMHGGQKLFVYGFDGVSGAFAQMGIPLPNIMGPFIGFVEFLGGIALVLGLLTRVAALGLAANMLVAILTVHVKDGFFNPTGVEFPLSLLGAAMMLAIVGAGEFSIDAMIAKWPVRAPAQPFAFNASSGESSRRAA